MFGSLLSDSAFAIAPIWRRLNRWGTAAVEINDRHIALWQPGASAAELAPLPAGLVVAGVPQKAAALGDLLGDLVLQAGLNLRSAAALLPSGQTEWRLLRLEPDAGLNGKRLPLGEGQGNLQLLPMAGPGEWLALLNKSETIDCWIEVFAIADLELDFLEVAELAQLRALGIELGDPKAADCLLLDLQASASLFTFWQGGQPVYRHCMGPALGAGFMEELNGLLQRLEHGQKRLQQQPLWLVGSELLEPGLLEGLQKSSKKELQLAPLARAFSADPLTDAAFAGLIGTAQRIADG